MSGTRSTFPKAPAIEALIVAHGQPSDPTPAEAALAGLAARVGAHLPGARIASATLAAPDALEQAVAGFRGRFAVYPMFMASGWFVDSVLPRRLKGADCRQMPPLGLDPGLVDVAARNVASEVARRGWVPDKTELFLAGHGSAKGPAAARSASAFAEALRQRVPGPICVGFIEERPFVGDVAAALRPHSLCLPFFAANGDHVRCDLQHALNCAGLGDAMMAPLGNQPGLAGLIARAIGRFATKDRITA